MSTRNVRLEMYSRKILSTVSLYGSILNLSTRRRSPLRLSNKEIDKTLLLEGEFRTSWPFLTLPNGSGGRGHRGPREPNYTREPNPHLSPKYWEIDEDVSAVLKTVKTHSHLSFL